MQNLSHENEFSLHVNGNSFSYERLNAPRLAFKKRHKEIGNSSLLFCPIFPSIGFLHHFQTQAYELSRAQKKNLARNTCSANTLEYHCAL